MRPWTGNAATIHATLEANRIYQGALNLMPNYQPWRPAVGETILTVHDYHDPASIQERVVTKVGRDTIQCGSAENTHYLAWAWPITYKQSLTDICTQLQARKKHLDDGLTLITQLRNELARSQPQV